MPRINMGPVSIDLKSFEPNLDLVRKAVANFKPRDRIML